MATAATRRHVLSGLTAMVGAPALLRAGRAEGAAPSVRVRSNTGVGLAPWGVFFEAAASGFGVPRPLHDLRYRWSFADPGELALLRPDNPFGRDRNLAYGPWSVHAFTRPGLYLVTCEVTDGTRRATGSTRIEIRDPDRFFGRRNPSVVVSRSGDFTGAPRGSQRARSFAEAVARVTPGRGPWPPTRILLRAGETHSTEGVEVLDRFRGLYIGRFGPGPRPVLQTPTHPLTLREMLGFAVIADIDLEGRYDSTRGTTGPGGGPPVEGFRFQNFGAHPLTVHNCRSRGHRVALSARQWADVGPVQLVLSEFDMSDWKTFGVVLQNADQGGMVGCRLAMQPETSSGPGGESGADWPEHGPYRDSLPGRFTIHQCEMFSRAGWSKVRRSGDAHQQCIRLNSEGGVSGKGMVERCILEGGFSIFNAFANSGAQPRGARPCDYIIEKNYMLATPNTRVLGQLGFGGTTMRNNILVLPRTPQEHIGFGRSWLRLDPGLGQPAPGNDAPIEIYNNTLVDLRSNGLTPRAGPMPLTNEVPPGLTLAADNNLVHQPNLDRPNTPFAPLEAGPALFAPLYDGKRYNDGFDPAYATPPGTPASYRPLPGSPALGAASAGRVALDDITGRLREGPTAVGAFHDETPWPRGG